MNNRAGINLDDMYLLPNNTEISCECFHVLFQEQEKSPQVVIGKATAILLERGMS